MIWRLRSQVEQDLAKRLVGGARASICLQGPRALSMTLAECRALDALLRRCKLPLLPAFDDYADGPPPPPSSPSPRRSKSSAPAHSPGYRTPVEREDRADRDSGRIPEGARAPFYYLIGDAPDCPPGEPTTNRLKAAAYEVKIRGALDHGGWTRAEATRLRQLLRKWHDRADNLDSRFWVMGNSKGGPNQHQQRQILEHRRTTDAIRATRAEAGAEVGGGGGVGEVEGGGDGQ